VNMTPANLRAGESPGVRIGRTDTDTALDFPSECRMLAMRHSSPVCPRNFASDARSAFCSGKHGRGRKDYAGAEKYSTRILDINLKTPGENSTRTAQSLGILAGLPMAQG